MRGLHPFVSKLFQTICAVIVFISYVDATEDDVISGFVPLDPLQETVGGTVNVNFLSRAGRLIETAPVTSSGYFALHKAPSQADGVYIAEVSGVLVNEYSPFLVQIREGKLVGVIRRKSPLIFPPPLESKAWKKRGTNLTFVSVGKTNYEKKRPRWRLKHLWAYKVRILQLLGVAIVLWFPKVIRDLPQDMREELMGEKEVDLGDANALIKALTGRATETQAASETKQK